MLFPRIDLRKGITLKRLIWKSLEVSSDSTRPLPLSWHRFLVPQLTTATCERNHWLLYTINRNVRGHIWSFQCFFFFKYLPPGYTHLWLDARESTAVYLYCAMLIVFEHSTSRVACMNKYTHTHTRARLHPK